MTDTATTVGFPGFAPKPGHPAYYDDELDAWQVFRYAETQRVLSDFTVFSSSRGALDPNDTAATGSDSLIDLDPPAHRQLRSLITTAFTARNVATLADWVSGVCDALLDAVIDRGEMDLVADFANKLPLRVIGRLAGFPEADLEQLRAWGHSSSDVRSPAAIDAQRKLADYFAALIADRTANPRADLLSELITAQVDGQRLTRTQIVAACVLLLTAGSHTVRDLIGNAWLCFDRHPDALAELRADPTLVPSAIEEVLRYLPPVPQFPRITAVDTHLDDRPVAAGQWVMARIPSANRDPAHFPRPDQFDIHRRPNRHLTLGHGIHFCLGAPLARMETTIALQTMLRRLPEVHIVPDTPLIPHVSPFAYGMEHLPITFTPS